MGAILAQTSPSPFLPPGCRPYNAANALRTRSTLSEPNPVDSYPALVEVTRTPPSSAFATPPRRHATTGTRERPECLRPVPFHAAAPLSPTSPDRGSVLARWMRSRVATRDTVTSGPRRRRGYSPIRLNALIPTQSCAKIDPFRCRNSPYNEMFLLPSSGARAVTLQLKLTFSLLAFSTIPSDPPDRCRHLHGTRPPQTKCFTQKDSRK